VGPVYLRAVRQQQQPFGTNVNGTEHQTKPSAQLQSHIYNESMIERSTPTTIAQQMVHIYHEPTTQRSSESQYQFQPPKVKLNELRSCSATSFSTRDVINPAREARPRPQRTFVNELSLRQLQLLRLDPVFHEIAKFKVIVRRTSPKRCHSQAAAL